jgi:hypothetical protein
MKASLIAFDFRELYKKPKIKIVNMGMSEAAQNSQQPKSGRSKL